MQRPARGLRTLPGARVAELERRAPEWGTWLRLLVEVERALADPGWGAAAAPYAADAGADRAPVAPLLHDLTLAIDARRATRLLRRLLTLAAAEPAEGAATLARYRPRDAEALRLLTAVTRRDRDAVARLAAAGGTDPAALTAVAELAVIPPLHAAGRQLRGRAAAFWPHGYCPVCGAWPVLAELRGLERSRVLRCGRCGADWPWEWLRCVFCGEREHARLGLLVAEETRESRRAETCSRCHGYLKSVATLQPPPAFELLVLDLETVELDLAALARGFARPEGNGHPLDIRLVGRPRFLHPFTDG